MRADTFFPPLSPSPRRAPLSPPPLSPGNKFSFRASRVYQDRGFKFIPVAPSRCSAGAHCGLRVSRRSNDVARADIGPSLEYRCPRFPGFPFARNISRSILPDASTWALLSRPPLASLLRPPPLPSCEEGGGLGEGRVTSAPIFRAESRALRPTEKLFRNIPDSIMRRDTQGQQIPQRSAKYLIAQMPVQYICSIRAPGASRALRLSCVSKFTRCLRDTCILFT